MQATTHSLAGVPAASTRSCAGGRGCCGAGCKGCVQQGEGSMACRQAAADPPAMTAAISAAAKEGHPSSLLSKVGSPPPSPITAEGIAYAGINPMVAYPTAGSVLLLALPGTVSTRCGGCLHQEESHSCCAVTDRQPEHRAPSVLSSAAAFRAWAEPRPLSQLAPCLHSPCSDLSPATLPWPKKAWEWPTPPCLAVSA